MTERLYGGKTIDEVFTYLLDFETWPGSETEVMRDMIARIRELEEALKFYADKSNYGHLQNDLLREGGERARKARGGER